MPANVDLAYSDHVLFNLSSFVETTNDHRTRIDARPDCVLPQGKDWQLRCIQNPAKEDHDATGWCESISTFSGILFDYQGK